MLKSIRNVSVTEASLLDAIRKLEFGEICGIEIVNAPFDQVEELSEPEWGFVSFIRTGIPRIDNLAVHMGQPALAEVDVKINGFRCVKKKKFSTS